MSAGVGVVGEMPEQSTDIQDQECQERVRQAMDRLAARHRQPVELRYLAGLDFPAVAAALRLRERTARTARTRVSRCLAQLRELLGVSANRSTWRITYDVSLGCSVSIFVIYGPRLSCSMPV